MLEKLEWGAHWLVPKGVVAARGARAILEKGEIVLVRDRMAWIGEEEAAQARLRPFLLGSMNELRRWARMVSPSSDAVFQVERNGCVLVATPHSSCGYLYIAAWLTN